MIDPFDSPRRSLRRAKHHVANVKANIIEFGKDDPWTAIRKKHPDGITESFKLKFRRRLADDTPSIVFDAAQNLRAALDQMVFGIAVLHTGTARPKHCAFPFGPTYRDFSGKIKGRCKDVPRPIRSYLRRLKAYKRGNPTLWAMNELANSKHFSVVPVYMGNIAWKLDEVEGVTIVNRRPFYDSAKNEIVVFSARVTGKPHYKGEARFFVSLDHPEKLIGRVPLLRLLNEMIGVVEGILLGAEAECRRIGLIK